MVLSVISGESTEITKVKACLTWKPLSVPTLMGRMKWGRVKVRPPPFSPHPHHTQASGTALALSTARPKSPSRPLHHEAAVSHQDPHPPTQLPKPPALPPPVIRPPFSSNHAVWPSSPAFNLPSRSGAEANEALG